MNFLFCEADYLWDTTIRCVWIFSGYTPVPYLRLQLESGHMGLNELPVSHWKPLDELGLEESFLSLTVLPFPQHTTLTLYLPPCAMQSQAGTCKHVRMVLQSRACMDTSKFCTKVCKRSYILLWIAVTAVLASLHLPLHWFTWSPGSRREGSKPQALTMCNQTELPRHAKMHLFSRSCLLYLDSYFIFLEERAFSLFKLLILKSVSKNILVSSRGEQSAKPMLWLWFKCKVSF